MIQFPPLFFYLGRVGDPTLGVLILFALSFGSRLTLCFIVDVS
jgi:hypothetical protein